MSCPDPSFLYYTREKKKKKKTRGWVPETSDTRIIHFDYTLEQL